MQTTAGGGGEKHPLPPRRSPVVPQEGKGGGKPKSYSGDKLNTKPKPFAGNKVGDGYKPYGKKPDAKPFAGNKVGGKSVVAGTSFKGSGGGKFGERPQRRTGGDKSAAVPRSKGIIVPVRPLRRDPLAGRSGVLSSPNPRFELPLWVDFGNYQPFVPTVEDEAKTWLLTTLPLEPTAFCRGVSAEAEVGHRGGVLTRGHWSSLSGLRQRGGKLFPRFAARLRRYRVRTWWGGQ